MREYQTRAYEKLRNAIALGYKRILCVSPTGSGKSVLAAHLMRATAEKGKSSIFLADRRELNLQLAGKCDDIGLPTKIVLAQHNQEFGGAEDQAVAERCHVIGKDTLWARAFRSTKMELPPADVIHVDECHGAVAKVFKTILSKYPNAYVIGWTATPCRGDGKGLGELFQTMVQVATYAELQAGGYLVPAKVFCPSHPDLDGLKVSKGDYVRKALEGRMNKDAMVGDIVAEWRKHAESRSTIVFAAGVEHSLHIRNEFRVAGISSEHIDGKTDVHERADILGRVGDGYVMALCNYGVATTGIDLPIVKYLVCARPTKSFGLWRQMGGRAQRPYRGHDHFVVQDHSDNSLEFGYPDEDVEWSLDPGRKIKHIPKNKPGEKQPTLPRECPKCGSGFLGPKCPECGYAKGANAQKIKMAEGKLAELERKRINKASTTDEKHRYWKKCIGVCIQKGWTINRAAGMYKSHFGVWPRGFDDLPRGLDWKLPALEFYHRVRGQQKEAVFS